MPPHFFYQMYFSFFLQNDCIQPKCGELSEYTDGAHTELKENGVGVTALDRYYNRAGVKSTGPIVPKGVWR